MIKKLGPLDLLKAVKSLIEKNTNVLVYDAVPKNAESPFYFIELAGLKPDNTKTMWVDNYTVWVHAIAEETKRSQPILEMIEDLQEAMTDAIELGEEFELLEQSDRGLNVLKEDETGEKHAVLSYEFKVCYGFKSKV